MNERGTVKRAKNTHTERGAWRKTEDTKKELRKVTYGRRKPDEQRQKHRKRHE
jgi:hypothetical protein